MTCDLHIVENMQGGVVLLQENTLLLNVTTNLLRDWEIFAHSPCYPDLAPCYFLSYIVK